MNSIFRMWIDAPVDGRQPSVRFVIRGWCYRCDGLPIHAIRARTSTRTFEGIYGGVRPDVARAFNDEPGSVHSGFEIPVTLHWPAGTVHVESRSSDGRWHVVQTMVFDRRRPIAWRDPVKWSRFWALALAGRPAAWAPLIESERDFAVACARQRGWVNLFVGPHHAPKALTQERFPAHRLSAERLPRITIVTPSFQQGRFLDRTMTSVLDQRDVHIDYVVQDGGSTDGSVAVIHQHVSRLAYWESCPDGGQADAIGRGFSAVGQRPDDVMMFLNSDDVLLEGAGHFVAEYFAQHPDVDVVYGHRIFIDEAGREIGRWFTPRQPFVDTPLHDFVPQETLFWRRRIWDRVGGIDRSLKFALDWDLFLRFVTARATIVRLPWFLAGFRIHPGQKTHTSLHDVGIPEMDRLRARSLGRAPTHDELHVAMRRAELDSALVYALWQRGWRI